MRRQQGFTLVELVVVMVLIGIIAGVLAMQLGPVIQGYLAIERRASLTSLADTALRKVATDVRGAVPNSLRLLSPQCMELAPTIDGGRYRAGPDTANSANPGLFLDSFEAKTTFDVLTAFRNPVAAGDLVVIGNQSPDDLYGDASIPTIRAITATPGATTGAYRIELNLPKALPAGYDGGRFVVVPGGARSVTYVCTADGKIDNGSANGVLYRVTSPALVAAPAGCPAAGAGTPVLATNVESCSFVYSPNQGATQESGYVQLQLRLTKGGESVSLTMGAHVDNVP